MRSPRQSERLDADTDFDDADDHAAWIAAVLADEPDDYLDEDRVTGDRHTTDMTRESV